MSDFHSQTSQHLYEIRARHNNERFQQLNGTLNTAVQGTWGYLLAVNGGGAAGILAFIGARSDLAKMVWPYIVLSVFVAGLIFVGLAHAFMVHKLQALIDNWTKNMDLYWKDEIGWSTLDRIDDDLVNHWAVVPWILGWGSLGFFLVGVCIAAYNFGLLAATR